MKLKKLIKHYNEMLDDINTVHITRDTPIDEAYYQTAKIFKSTLKALRDLQKYRKGEAGCENCKYAKVNITETPCKKCMRCWKDQWEWGGKDE